MKKWLLISIFIIGLGIFSYPVISDFLSTQGHQKVIKEYELTVKKLEKEQILSEREKADKHNEKLENAQLEFVDPFSEQTTNKRGHGNNSYYDALNIGPALGKLEIPKIKAELPIYHGTSDEVLSRGVGHLENSSLPTGETGTHSVFTAHRGLPSSKLFRSLDDLTIGDQFFVQVLDETYTYEIFDVDIVLPHETDWLQMNEDEEIVTLLTCEPYMINTHRLLVKGKRIPHEITMEKEGQGANVTSSEQAENIAERGHKTSSANWLIFGICIFVLLIVLLSFYQIRKKVGVEHEDI